ncbi:hypothetical protein AB836_00825 [Rickettsiales bacterium (ex Bugula neritina AB1)]|nr:hypothetical protein AB836_00825 [Rickettsiales bacterium (ex Bugula neritina AB1)]
MFKNKIFNNSDVDEYVLVEEWQKTKDPGLLEKIINRHIYLIKDIANKYSRENINHHDLLGEGIIGFIHALENFDIKKKVKISTYVYYWIVWKMKEFTWKIKNIITVSNSSIHRLIKHMMMKIKNGDTSKEQALEDISLKTSLSQKIIRKKMKELSIHITSMSQRISSEDDQLMTWENIAENNEYENLLKNKEIDSTMKEIHDIVNKLSDRHKYIIEHKWLLQDKNFESLGKDLNLSKERVRQLEKEAIKFIKKKVKEKNISFSFMSIFTMYFLYNKI